MVTRKSCQKSTKEGFPSPLPQRHNYLALHPSSPLPSGLFLPSMSCSLESPHHLHWYQQGQHWRHTHPVMWLGSSSPKSDSKGTNTGPWPQGRCSFCPSHLTLSEYMDDSGHVIEYTLITPSIQWLSYLWFLVCLSMGFCLVLVLLWLFWGFLFVWVCQEYTFIFDIF